MLEFEEDDFWLKSCQLEDLVKTVNIFGDCVARDMLENLISEKMLVVKKYVSFINPISLFTKQQNLIDIPVLDWGSDFAKRNLQLDISKRTLNYLFSETSDYIIVNPLDLRMDMYVKDNASITISNIVKKNPMLVQFLEKNGYRHIGYEQISVEGYIVAWRKLFEKILEHYDENQIILNDHLGSFRYLKGIELKSYGKKQCDRIRQYNTITNVINEDIRKLHPGIHILPWVESTYCDARHKWGLHPLHYASIYYEYCNEAMKIVLRGGELYEEKKKIDLLKEEYETVFLKNEIQIQEGYYKYTVRKMNIYLNYAKQLIGPYCQLKKKIEEFGITSIALYGDFKLAELLKVYFEAWKVDVKYMISDWDNHTCSTVYKTNLKEYPNVDMLVICDIKNAEKIKEKVKDSFKNILLPKEILSR